MLTSIYYAYIKHNYILEILDNLQNIIQHYTLYLLFY